MRNLLRVLTLLAVMAVVPTGGLQSSSGSASACSCLFPSTEQETRARIASAPLAVVASVEGYTGDTEDDRLVMTVESVLNDQRVPASIVINQAPGWAPTNSGEVVFGADCSLYIPATHPDKYLLISGDNPSAEIALSWCSGSNALESVDSEIALPGIEAILNEASGLPDPDAPAHPMLQEEEDHEEKDLPWVPIVILAFLIPAAVLLIPSFLGKKGSGGH
jgi:hypothetical protein